MQKPQFTENQIYHIYNRGVEKRDVFLDKKDYFRFVHDLFELNDKNSVSNLGRSFDFKFKDVKSRLPEEIRRPR
ncbi:MAG: hypothetical protein KGJ01_02495 [Patescibacteria group bacterium]|nr:hypothetical protein [Patescibacteria group bacterium]